MRMAYLKEECLDVCENGDIFTREGKKLKHVSDKLGYLRVYYNHPSGKRKNYSVHRLLALAFIPNPENKPDVNHINGIKSDFSLSNLEWNTRGENMRHAKNTGLWNRRMGIEHVPTRNKIIMNLYKLGTPRKVICEAFELNDFVVDQAIRDNN